MRLRKVTRGALAAASFSFTFSGCKSESSPATQGPASGATGAASAAGTSPARASEAAATGAAANAKCPAGRWSYDYSDQALEVMMKNVAGAKVIKEEGSFICNVSEGSQGMIDCATQGRPVVNVVETQQAGIKTTISITIDGKAFTKFTLVDAQRMHVTSSDISGLKIDAQVTLGGKQVPFPTDQLVGIFGKSGSTMSYKCEDGKLYIKQQIDNAETAWQRLEPVR